MAEKAPEGWYPDGTGATRWWDGDQWTEHFAPPPPGPTATLPAAETVITEAGRHSATEVASPVESTPANVTIGTSRPWYRKKRWWVIAAVVIIIGAAGATGSGDQTTPTADSSSSGSPTDAPTAEDTVDEETASPEPVEETEPALTAGQENAIGAAEGYLDYTAFSKKGLIQQLEFDHYSEKDAKFAVEYVHPNYKEQAAKAAKDYLDYTSFSRQGLIQQLMFDGYNRENATYGVGKAGL